MNAWAEAPPGGRRTLRWGAWLVVAGLAGLLGCRSKGGTAAAGDGGRHKGTRLMEGARKVLSQEPAVMSDGGILVATFVSAGGVNMWPVDREALAGVLDAMRAESGTALAKVLENHPAVSPELVARARAVNGRQPVGEQAEVALVGPLSLPVGGAHTPVMPGKAGLTPPDPTCHELLEQPGATGQVLAGVGRTRVIMLLQGDHLLRYAGCVARSAPPADASQETHAEYQRLQALMKMGMETKAAVLVGLGPAD